MTVLVIVIAFGFYGYTHGHIQNAFDALFQVFRLTSQDVRAMDSAEALRYATNCEAYIGAGAISKYQKNCWASAVKGDPWLANSPHKPGMGRNFGRSTVKCFPPGSSTSTIQDNLSVYYVQKKPEAYKSSCVVENFKLPQNIDSGGQGFFGPLVNSIKDALRGNRLELNPQNWIKGYGDPKYLIYYGSFPQGESEDWRMREEDINRVTIMISSAMGAGLNLLAGVGPMLLRGVAKTPRAAKWFFQNRGARYIGDYFDHPLHRALLRLGLATDDEAAMLTMRGLTDQIDDIALKNTDELRKVAREEVIEDLNAKSSLKVDSREGAIQELMSETSEEGGEAITRGQANAKFRQLRRTKMTELLEDSGKFGKITEGSFDISQYLAKEGRSRELVDKYREVFDLERKLFKQGASDEAIERQVREQVDDLFSVRGPIFASSDDGLEALNNLKRAKFADDMAAEAKKVYNREAGEFIGSERNAKKVIELDLRQSGIPDAGTKAEEIIGTMKEHMGKDEMYDQVRRTMFNEYEEEAIEHGGRSLKDDLVGKVIKDGDMEHKLLPRTWRTSYRAYTRSKDYLRYMTSIVNPKAYGRMFKRVVKFPAKALFSLSKKEKSTMMSFISRWGPRLMRSRIFQVEVYNIVERNADIPDWAQRGLVAQQCRAGFMQVRYFRTLSTLGKGAACWLVSGLGMKAAKADSVAGKYKSEGINTYMLSKALLDYGRVGSDYFGKSNSLDLNQYAKRYTIRLSKGDNPGGDTKTRFYAASPCEATVVIKNKTESCNFDLVRADEVRDKFPDTGPIRDVVKLDGKLYFSPYPIFSFGKPPGREEWNSVVQMEGGVKQPGLFGSDIKTRYEEELKEKCMEAALPNLNSLSQYKHDYSSYEKYDCGHLIETHYYQQTGKIEPMACIIWSKTNFARFRDCLKKEVDNRERKELAGNELGAKRCGKASSPLRKALPFLSTQSKNEVNMLSISFQPPGGDWEQGSHNYCYKDNPLLERAQYWGIMAGSFAVEMAVAAAISTATGGAAAPGLAVAIAADTFTGGAVTFMEQLAVLNVKKSNAWPNR